MREYPLRVYEVDWTNGRKEYVEAHSIVEAFAVAQRLYGTLPIAAKSVGLAKKQPIKEGNDVNSSN